MNNFMKSYKWLGLGVFLMALIIVLAKLGLEAFTQVKPKKTESAIEESSNTDMIDRQEVVHVHGTDDFNHKSSKSKEIRHQDMLSEEMKQAIRDKLLMHGPMEVINHPDGRIELPSGGRFTQIPVAVEMPDGSIQIKEYTTLPK